MELMNTLIGIVLCGPDLQLTHVSDEENFLSRASR